MPVRLNLTNFVDAIPESAKKTDFQIVVIHGYLTRPYLILFDVS